MAHKKRAEAFSRGAVEAIARAVKQEKDSAAKKTKQKSR